MNITRKLIYLFLIAILPFGITAQTQPFENEIVAFEQADKTTPPPRNLILFTGSSSIRLWENLGSYFPKKTVLNRGFGGSKLTDVLHYADRIIIPYNPKQIVIYAGENDVASGTSGQETYKNFVALFEHIRRKLPNVPIAFISMKPSPSRRKYFTEIDAGNQLIKHYLSKQKRTDYVDIVPVMFTPAGQPVPELFKSDSLHMLPAGYERWAKVLKPYLK